MNNCALYIIGFALLLASCGNNTIKEENLIDPDQYSKNLEKANNLYAQSEEVQIDDFINRNGWDMTKTGTGLRYMIYKEGQGRKVEDNVIVRYNFKVNLINGVLCDESSKTGPK